MKPLLPVLAVLSCASLACPASAAVTYTFDSSPIISALTEVKSLDFNPFGQHFEFTTSSYIDKYTKIDGNEANCSYFIFACTSVEFSPGTDGDVITINYSFGEFPVFARFQSFDVIGGSDSYTFDPGVFGAPGKYTSVELATLTVSVSAVPLPAAAPLFGAALLALGAVGFSRRNKVAATT